MSLRRKVLRAQGYKKQEKPLHCCGERMLTKPMYETDTEIFYVCPNCGREKWVKKEKTE